MRCGNGRPRPGGSPGRGLPLWRRVPFAYHCGMASLLTTALNIRRDDVDLDLARRMIAVWRRAAPILLHGDYYPRTPHSRAADRWLVRQFGRPERGIGLVQVPHAGRASATRHAIPDVTQDGRLVSTESRSR